MADPSSQRARPDAYWLVLTPSVDQAAWRREIERVASDAGFTVISLEDDPSLTALYDTPDVLVLTDDASEPLKAGVAAERIAAVVPDPGSAYEMLEDRSGIIAPHSVWYASTLLAKALELAPLHQVISASDLARRPQSIRLFDRLTIAPPQSGAEHPRRPAVRAAFAIYDSPAGPEQPVHWADRLFTYDERASRDAVDWGVLDITGRPRLLVYGPYLALPRGMWRACIRFGVDKDAASHQYRVDWGTRTACVSEYVNPGAPGIYEIELDFEWTATDAAEIRLILTEGSFMGTLLFMGITVERSPQPRAAARQAAA